DQFQHGSPCADDGEHPDPRDGGTRSALSRCRARTSYYAAPADTAAHGAGRPRILWRAPALTVRIVAPWTTFPDFGTLISNFNLHSKQIERFKLTPHYGWRSASTALAWDSYRIGVQYFGCL